MTRYHLWFAASLRQQPRGVPTHSRAVTGAPGARLLSQKPLGCRLRGVFRRQPSPLSSDQGLSWQGETAYFSASMPYTGGILSDLCGIVNGKW